MHTAILDTCVITDMFVETRQRHAQAKLLKEDLLRAKTIIRMPMFGMFEIASAMRSELRKNAGCLVKAGAPPSFDTILQFDFVPIDLAFFQKYYDAALPHLRAGDLVFAAMARVDRVPLITEDIELLTATKAMGAIAFTIAEARDELSKQAA